MAELVTGLQTVITNIEKEVNMMRGRTLLGMTKAMNHLHRETETSRPLVPRDTNAMAQSWYIFPLKTGINPVVVAGYTMPYAPYVHENLDAINWTRIGSGPKWLQIHFERNRREMQLIIAKHASIKK